MNAVLRLLTSPFQRRQQTPEKQEREDRAERRERMIRETERDLESRMNPFPRHRDRVESSGGRTRHGR